ncbi:MAG: hypothetical protein HRU07_03945 [Nitrosopumilus sp.]|nr:hypothetical protein [Nitrosopumilus sp.]NRA05307.1 hypothetical protein [Nitrosopumilus sp.]
MHKQTIAVRAYTVPKSMKKPQNNTHFEPKTHFDRVIVWDTETTTDLYQNLKFGYFEILQQGILEHTGLFYDESFVSPRELDSLQSVSKSNLIQLYSIDEFREIFLREVYDLESLCVGFNLPFDITRIALKSTNAKVKKKNAFSLLLSENLHYPRLLLTHQTNTLSFIAWGTTKHYSKNFKGNFLDLRTLSHALTDTKHTLESACKSFDTKFKKYKSAKHGKITIPYIQYCINDVKSTYSLYLNAKAEFDTYGINIPLTRVYTPATIGKQFLKQLGIKSFTEQNPKFSPDMIGHLMTGYFGGRVECKIRKTPVKVDLLDFLSMYPTVCTLQNLWKFVIAQSITQKDVTDEIISFVDSFEISQIQDPSTWEKLQVMVQLVPDGDTLPIRARFGQKHAWNIGICKISSNQPLWYSLSDVLAAKMYGKTPKILKAIRFIPVGVQKNLKEIDFHGIHINPYEDDLFKKLIEYRQELKIKRDSCNDSDEYSKYDRKQQVIKIITNATSYGIFVEINTLDETEPILIDVYGINHFTTKKKKIEKTGFMFNPIIAIAITSASRLLLATTECLLKSHGASHAYCDTDSMAIPPKYTKEIQEFFKPLNPYSFDAEIFKLEKSNVWFYGISSKRYCLYTIKDDIITIDSKKYSAHGLGHLLDPLKNSITEDSKWHKQIWQDILELHHGFVSRESLIEKYQSKYTIQQLSTSTPVFLSRFSKFNKGKPYFEQIKPGNFTLLGFPNRTSEVTGESIKPFAPYHNPAKLAVYGEFIDYNNKDGSMLRGEQYWKTFWSVFEDYLRHPESKFDGDTGVLERKAVWITEVIHIGKESNGLDESEILGFDEDSYVEYSDVDSLEKKFRELTPKILELMPKDVEDFGVSKQTLWNTIHKIRIGQLHRISNKTKIKLLELF